MKRQYGQIEEFVYSCEDRRKEISIPETKLYRVKLITEKSIFGMTFTSVNVIPFVFRSEKTAKEFLQHDISYKMICSTYYRSGSMTVSKIPICEIKFNEYNTSAYVVFDQKNVYVENDSYTSYIRYMDDIRIFEDILYYPKDVDIADKIRYNNNVGHYTYQIHFDHDFEDYCYGLPLKWTHIEDFLNYIERKRKPKKQFNVDEQITNISKYELLRA